MHRSYFAVALWMALAMLVWQIGPNKVSAQVRHPLIPFSGLLCLTFDVSPFPLKPSSPNLDIYVNATWNNASLAAQLCTLGTSDIRSLAIRTLQQSLTIWVALPSCFYSWTTIETLTLSGIMAPDFAILPASIKKFSIERATDLMAASPPLEFDWTKLNHMTSLTELQIKNTNLGGYLPTCICSPTFMPPLTYLDVSNNRIQGGISPNFFSLSTTLLNFVAERNELSGEIPNFGFGTLRELTASYNRFNQWQDFDLSGIHPNNGVPALVKIAMADNPLQNWPTNFNALVNLNVLYLICPRTGPGSISNGTTPRPFPVTDATILTQLSQIAINYCPVLSKLPDFPFPNSDQTKYCSVRRSFDFSNTLVFGPIPHSWQNYAFLDFIISGCSSINGTFPTNMFGCARFDSGASSYTGNGLRLLALDGTSLEGEWTLDPEKYFPSYLASLSRISLKDMPFMDFCSPNTPSWSDVNVAQCVFGNSNASSCPDNYPSSCTYATPEEPTISPISNLQPSTHTPQNSGNCPPLSPALYPLFSCINDTWVSQESVSVPTVTIPPNGDLLIFGNLSTGSVVFEGLSGSLKVKGCISSNLTCISVEITESDIKKLEKAKDKQATLLLLDSDSESSCEGGTNLNKLGLSISSRFKSSCKKVKAEKVKNGSSSKTFSAVFTLDTSKCNLWWIILVSVIGGILLIATIVIVLLVVLVPSVRHAIRPYSKKRAAT